MLQEVDEHETSGMSPNRGQVTVHAHARAAQENQYRQQLHQLQHLQRQLETYDDRLERLKHQPDEDRKERVEQRDLPPVNFMVRHRAAPIPSKMEVFRHSFLDARRGEAESLRVV